MRILFISNLNPHFENTNTYRLKAMHELGHDPIFFEDRDFILPGRIRQKIGFLQKWDLGLLNRRMVEVAKKTRPQLCLVVGGYRISAHTLACLRDMGINNVLWTTDPPRPEFKHIVATAHLYDHVFCAGTEAIDILANTCRKDAAWLPFGCDLDVHCPMDLNHDEKLQYGRDLVFVGAYYPYRWEILKNLIGRYDIGIWGPGWEQVAHEQYDKSIYPGPLNHTQWVKLYNATKIVIIIHYQDGITPSFQASPKVFEALACRSFVLVDTQRDVFKLFSSGKELVGFDGNDDLNIKIEHFLSREEERREIAAAGYQVVIQRHSYRHRLKTILDRVESE